jgi:hypothetical protein
MSQGAEAPPYRPLLGLMKRSRLPSDTVRIRGSRLLSGNTGSRQRDVFTIGTKEERSHVREQPPQDTEQDPLQTVGGEPNRQSASEQRQQALGRDNLPGRSD